MMKIFNNRANFYQWDLEQKLEIEDSTITEVHFDNAADTKALVCEVYEQDGKKLVNVPNILLQQALDIRAYAFCGDCYTKQYERFKVIARAKPDDYVYTETEVRTLAALDERVDALEAKGIKDGKLILDNGLDIRTQTEVDGEVLDSFNYIKIGKDLDNDALMSIKGWDSNVEFGQGNIELKTRHENGLSINMQGDVDLSGGGAAVRINSSGGTLEGTDFKLTRYGETVDNSIATIGDIKEVVANKADKEEWEKINSKTLEEDSIPIISTDMNGNPFNLKKFMIIVWHEAKAENTASQSLWLHAITPNSGGYKYALQSQGYKGSVQSTHRFDGELWYYWNIRAFASQGLIAAPSAMAYAYLTVPYGCRYEFMEYREPITGFRVTFGISGVLNAGTRIEVWGVRA